MAWLVRCVAVMYDDISGGRVSKPMTFPSEVIEQYEERRDEAIQNAVAEERERIILALSELATGHDGCVSRWDAIRIVQDRPLDEAGLYKSAE
jgi:hypothetical protein